MLEATTSNPIAMAKIKDKRLYKFSLRAWKVS
jgi:hypothetical protein